MNTIFTQTLIAAKKLQKQYTKLGAGGHQNVRNPYPFRVLVGSVLPKIISPDAPVKMEMAGTFTINGKAMVERSNISLQAKLLLPKDHWETRGMTVETVFALLQAQGYIVTKANVRQTLSNFYPSVPMPNSGQLRTRLYYFPTDH